MRSERSEEFSKTVNRALQKAFELKHHTVTLVHWLYALCQDKNAREIFLGTIVPVTPGMSEEARLEKATTKLAEFELKLLHHLENEMHDLVNTEVTEDQIKISATGARVLQRAQVHIKTSVGDGPVSGEWVLVAIFAEEHDPAFNLLFEAGLSRYNTLTYITHGQITGDKKAIEKEPELASAGGTANSLEKQVRSSALAKYSVDLNQRAREKKLDPIVGRADEITRMVRILSRRKKSNPILVGEPGVGKTAMAEALAQRIVEGDVPERLKKSVVYMLDMPAVVAGTKFRGDLEERLKQIVTEAQEDPDAILFIDEIHTLIGAGASSGSMDASSIMKPALARGEMRCIGATTYKEFQQIFSKEAALSRRFQKIDLKEPSPEEAVRILEGSKAALEAHHGVSFSSEIIAYAVKLAVRHIHGRFLPDKAIDVLDEVGARLRNADAPRGYAVSEADIEASVAEMAQIPSASMRADQREQIRLLEEDLAGVVYGQPDAIATVTKAIKLSKAGLRSPDRPIASFLFVGPTGVGKTELTKQLGKSMDMEVHRFDMSEYMEKHAVARLIGSPPGYVGYNEGGLLTSAVQRNPYSIVLLDEVEKAHPDMLNLLLQVFDHGMLTDATGQQVSFRNTIVVMTSNVGAASADRSRVGFSTDNMPNFRSAIEQAVKNYFTPEFRNRLTATVYFDHLKKEEIGLVVDKFIAELETQTSDRNIMIEISSAARTWLGEQGYDPKMGARPLARVIQDNVSTVLAEAILFGELQSGGYVTIGLEDGRLAFSFKPLLGDPQQRMLLAE